MVKENPWLPTYRPEICSESITIAKFIEHIKPKNEMSLLGFSL